jgi:hypothetical protein
MHVAMSRIARCVSLACGTQILTNLPASTTAVKVQKTQKSPASAVVEETRGDAETLGTTGTATEAAATKVLESVPPAQGFASGAEVGATAAEDAVKSAQQNIAEMRAKIQQAANEAAEEALKEIREEAKKEVG